MKKFIILLVLLISQQFAFSQYIVINSTNSGLYDIPFNDTLLSSLDELYTCQSVSYQVDLDGDHNVDVKFIVDCYMGGSGSQERMKIIAYNNLLIHVDSSYLEHCQYIYNGEVRDTIKDTDAIYKYSMGDTIYANQTPMSTDKYLLYVNNGYDPSCLWANLNLFVGDTSYIAFTKNMGKSSYIYFIKIVVPNANKLHLLWGKTNDPWTGISNNKSINELNIFPNPVSNSLSMSEEFGLFEIISLQGKLLMEGNISNNNTIDVSHLRKGIYLIKLKKDNSIQTAKFIKI